VITFATFPNGNMLVVGLTRSDETFGGIFSKSGELVRKVTIADDLIRRERKGQYYGRARDGVRLRIADDGMAYLITGRYFPKLSVFSPDGSLITSNPIKLPEGVEDLWLEQFSQGKMAAELISRSAARKQRTFALSDATTGGMLNEYQTSVFDNWLICYSADKDTFSFYGGIAIHLLRPSR
jgi:hypothetical protein